MVENKSTLPPDMIHSNIYGKGHFNYWEINKNDLMTIRSPDLESCNLDRFTDYFNSIIFYFNNEKPDLEDGVIRLCTELPSSNKRYIQCICTFICEYFFEHEWVPVVSHDTQMICISLIPKDSYLSNKKYHVYELSTAKPYYNYTIVKVNDKPTIANIFSYFSTNPPCGGIIETLDLNSDCDFKIRYAILHKKYTDYINSLKYIK